jgi:hypothetical protein
MEKLLNGRQSSINMEKIKNIKHKSEIINQEYNLNIEKLNTYEKDIDHMVKKTNALDHKLDKLLHSFK